MAQGVPRPQNYMYLGERSPKSIDISAKKRRGDGICADCTQL